MAHFKAAKIHIDYLVEIEHHRYSVPQILIGQVQVACITTAMVELMDQANAWPATPATTGKEASRLSPHKCRRRTTVPTWSGRRSG